MCSQQVDNQLPSQVDFVNVDEYEPSFQLIPPFAGDYGELVFSLMQKLCSDVHVQIVTKNRDKETAFGE
jgi:ABC-type cobalt transport system substrate-binding protein